MLQSMMSENMKHYVSFKPGTNCRHGHQIPTIDCQVGMECISGYEDALNMSADARFKICTVNDESKFTSPDEAAVTSPSPLWHKKVLHLMRVCYMQCCSTYDVFLRCILTNDNLLNLSYSLILYIYCTHISRIMLPCKWGGAALLFHVHLDVRKLTLLLPL